MRKNSWMVVVIVLAMGMAGLASAQKASNYKSRKSRKPAKEFVLPPLPSGPLQQLPLDQLPSVPPQVSYENGNLTIVAENSTLGDILREVRKRTGASIDVPGNPAERVAMRVGPGRARDVLATLLNGTSFNYVMVGSPADPAVLSSIVLTSKPSGPGTETAQNQPPMYNPPEANNFGPGTGRPGLVPPGAPMVPQPADTAEATDETDNSDEETAADDTSDQDQQQVGGIPADQNGQPPNAGPRTPQQILQMMQRNQQQQQLGQPGQPLPPQPPVNQEQ